MNQISKFYVLVYLCFSLASCMNKAYGPPGPLISARSLIETSEKIQPGYGANAFILVNKPHNNEDSLRVDAALSYYISLPSVREVQNSVPNNEICPIYWPVVDGSKKEILASRSRSIIFQKTDFARSHVLITKAKLSGRKGPFLVAFRPGTDINRSDEFLVFDMSPFSYDDMRNGFEVWERRVATDKQAWDTGFKMQYLRASFRSFLIKYSDCLYNIVMPGK